jgi:hypothetical protein
MNDLGIAVEGPRAAARRFKTTRRRVKTLTRYADPSGDAFETMRKAGRALGLPVTLVVDKDGYEIAAVEGGAKWDSAGAQALV